MSLRKTVTASHEKLKKSSGKVKSMSVEPDESGPNYIVTHHTSDYGDSSKHSVKASKLSAHCAKHMPPMGKKAGDGDE